LFFFYLYLFENILSRHSWLRRRLPKPPSEAPPPNRPSAVLRHHQLLAAQRQQQPSNDESALNTARTTSGGNGLYSNHMSSKAELTRHQKLPHIGNLQLNSMVD